MKSFDTIKLKFYDRDLLVHTVVFEVLPDVHRSFVYEYVGEWFKKNIDLSGRVQKFSVVLEHI